MKLVATICLLSFGFLSSAQVGINFKYQNINPEKWEKWTNNDALFSNSMELGVDYWFRLKNYRIEFLPEVFYSQSQSTRGIDSWKFNEIGLAFNTQFYILDFIGDCDCPTFSKDGNFFTKGFFLAAAPIFEVQTKTLAVNDIATKSTETAFGFHVGAGIDIGLTDLITITPFVRYKFLPNSKWDDLALMSAEAGAETTTSLIRYPQFGLRLGFRPDYVREQNKYRFRR